MAVRTTITIPDDLGERLEQVKNRFNVSRVCAEALRFQVEREELLLEAMKGPKMEQVKARLAKEKEQFFKDVDAEGEADGFKGGQHMDYGELYELAQARDKFGTDFDEDHSPWIVRNAACWKGWLEDEIEENRKDRESPFDEDSYLTGWLRGVLRFWDEVASDI